MSAAERDTGILRFAEQMLALLDRGSFVATYKYAVLLGLMDLCMEGTSRTGAAPDSVTTRQLADRVVELYWPHTVPYQGRDVLRQNTGVQAKILKDILRFRTESPQECSSLARCRSTALPAYELLLDRVEWTLILMPLPRVQRFGDRHVDLLYRLGWDLSIEKNRRVVTDYQRGKRSTFDNRIQLLEGVGDYLVRLNGLLRPLIHREWTAMVAQINKLEASELEGFLFGATRQSLSQVRRPLLEFQHARCFYCDGMIRSGGEVDHFVPWARYPNDGVHNLVVAHRKCNNNKRDRLAAAAHVERWLARNEPETSRFRALGAIAAEVGLDADRGRAVGIARAIYLRLPAGAVLWDGVDQLVEVEPTRLQHAFR